MATESVFSHECASTISVHNKGNNGVNICNKCVEYESYLKQALEEITSLRVINDLLQKDLTSHATLTRTLGIDLTYSNNNAVTNADGE